MKTAEDEPAIMAPPVILLLIGGMVLIHVLFTQILTGELRRFLFLNLAFIPSHLSEAKGVWTLVSYAFLHGSWEHLLINMVWLLAFGSAVARRMDSARVFLQFFVFCSVVAVLVHYFFAGDGMVPVIGASGGVAGMLGGASRFAFSNGLSFGSSLGPSAPRQRLLPFRKVFSRGTALIFIVLWIFLNVIFGLIPVSPGGTSVSIAWQSHLGGFFAGLFFIGWFEPPPLSPSGGPGNVDYGGWLGSGSNKTE